MPRSLPPERRPGAAGEDLACAYLARAGMRILARNFRCRTGEIDVVADDRGTTVFVEVRERSGSSHGTAVESVTPSKRRKVLRAARVYASGRLSADSPVRFDVVSIDWGPEGPRVRHDAGAFGDE